MQNDAQKVVEDLVSFLQSNGYKCAIVGSRVLARAGVLEREPNDWDIALPWFAKDEAIAFLEERGWKNNPDDERVYYGVSLMGFLKKEGCPSIDLVSSDLTSDSIDGLYINLKNAVAFVIKRAAARKKFEVLEMAIKHKKIRELISKENFEYAKIRHARKKKDG